MIRAGREGYLVRFISRSLLVLFLLYGLVFAIADAYLIQSHVPVWTLISFPVIWIGIQYLLAPKIIEMVFDIFLGRERSAAAGS
jgi:heat shock protein HtpX